MSPMFLSYENYIHEAMWIWKKTRNEKKKRGEEHSTEMGNDIVSQTKRKIGRKGLYHNRGTIRAFLVHRISKAVFSDKSF